MTLIRVEPNELQTISGFLNSTAEELGEIGRAVASVGNFAMPADLELVVRQLTTIIGAITTKVALNIALEATGLERRAVVAANDPLASASGVLWDPRTPAGGLGVSAPQGSFTIGGVSFGVGAVAHTVIGGASTIGGSSFSDSITVAPGTGGFTIGGNSATAGAPSTSWHEFLANTGGMVIGGGTARLDPLTETIAARQTDLQARLNGALSSPGLSANDRRVLSNLQTMNHNSMSLPFVSRRAPGETLPEYRLREPRGFDILYGPGSRLSAFDGVR